jgi:hypothetical protein
MTAACDVRLWSLQLRPLPVRCPFLMYRFACRVLFVASAHVSFLLQLCLPPVRMPRGLNLFKTEYERADYDLEKWRSTCRWITKRDTAVLDADDGAGTRCEVVQDS